MSAIEPPSLWPTSTGRSMPASASSAGQHVERLLVHEARRARRRPGRRTARGRRASRCSARRPVAARQPRREVAPQRDRPEPLVQEHERGLGARRSPRVSSVHARPPPHRARRSAARRPRARPARAPTAPRRARPRRGSPASLVARASARQRAPKPTCQRSSRSTSSMPCAAARAAGRRRALEQRDWPAVKTTPSRTMW